MAQPSAAHVRRNGILEAACEVVAERGFRDLRIVDVAKLAGCSTGTVHYHFDSKDELMREAFRFEHEASRERRKRALRGEDDPVSRLRKFADGYLPSSPATVRTWRVWMELWVSALRDPGMSAVNNVYYDEWRKLVLDAVIEGRDKGVLSVEDPLRCANTYVSMMDGLAIQVLVGAEHMDIDVMRVTCRAFVDGLTVGTRTLGPKETER